MVAVVSPTSSSSPDVDGLLGALAAAVDDVVATHAPGLHPQDRTALLAGVWHETDRLQVELAVLARTADLAGDWAAVGAVSATTWLSLLTGSSASRVRSELRVGAGLDRLGKVRQAGLDGTISWDACQTLAGTASGATLEAARRDEDELLGYATRLRVRDLVEAVRYWKAHVEAESDGGRPPDPAQRRSFRLATGSDGYGIGYLTLDPEATDLVERVLHHLGGIPTGLDRRSAPRRRADALVELCDAWDKGQVTGGRGGPTGLVVFPMPATPTAADPQPADPDHTPSPATPDDTSPADPDDTSPADLDAPPPTAPDDTPPADPDDTPPPVDPGNTPPPAGAGPTPPGSPRGPAGPVRPDRRFAPGDPPRTDTGTLVDPGWAERLTCTSPMARLVLGSDGLPLDVGREHRFATTAIWKALVARDGGCSHPWCDRPPGWCDAHHLDHPWDAGVAVTSVERMTLACNHHHHLLHHNGWSIHMHHGHPVWTDPHGQPVRPP